MLLEASLAFGGGMFEDVNRLGIWSDSPAFREA